MDKKRILIIEDDPMSVNIFAMYVRYRNLNIQFDHVEDGNKGVRLAKKNHYDGIYMNIGLPTISGIEACKLIRKHEMENNLKPVPIIAITASGDRKACLEAGMQAFISKPFSQEDMANFISYCEAYALNS